MAIVNVNAKGPLHCSSAVLGDDEAGEVWLCRCGRSGNKPHCDGSHNGHFDDAGVFEAGKIEDVEEAPTRFRTVANGPLMASGGLTVRDAAGTTVFQGRKAALCRCGHSASKPFCDGAHKGCGFQAP
jgi:CDGSH-type Zn-finger protein